MSRSNKSSKSQLRRRSIRVALVIALSAQAGWAWGDNGPNEIPQDFSTSVPELPAYPFSDGIQPAQSTKNKPQSSRQAVARILGFNRSASASSHGGAVAAPSALPALSNAPMLLPMLNPSMPKVDVHSAQAMINHPQISDSRVAVQSSNSSLKQRKLEQLPSMGTTAATVRSGQTDSKVVGNGATKRQSAIEHSLSDKGETQELPGSLALVNDLVNSLTPSEPAYDESTVVMPQFSDSMSIEVAEEPAETVVSMNFSDRGDCQETKLASATGEEDVVGQSQSLNGQVSTPTVVATAISSKPIHDQVFLKNVEPTNWPSTETRENPVQSAVSSRREPKLAGSKNDVQTPELQATTKQPLVPMLANASGRARVNVEPRALQPVPATSTAADSMPALVQNATLKAPQSVTGQAAAHQQVQGKEIRVAAKDSISLQSADNIQGLSVEHEDVCQVIQNGPKSYSVIGLRDGETRIAVISESAGQRNVQVQRVVVNSTKSAVTKDMNSLAAEVSQTVAQLYPRQRVRIAPHGNQLVISGSVDSEDTAKKIVSLVRKTTLAPVVDELKTK